MNIATTSLVAAAAIAMASPALAANTSPNPPANNTMSAAPANTSGTVVPKDTQTWMTHEQPGVWRASKLIGLNIYNPGNEKIGDINEVMVDASGRVKSVIIGVGGFLGMGERNVAVPFEDLKFVDRNRHDMTASAANGPVDRTANGLSTNPNVPANPPGETTGTVTTSGTAKTNAGTSHATTAAANTSGAQKTASASTVATGAEQYPDRAILDMNKDQLKAAPQFRYANE